MNDDCGDVHCVTCSDEGVPMRVLEPPVDGLARCADLRGVGGPTEVLTDLVGDVRAGDVVLVHAGTAISVTAGPESVR